MSGSITNYIADIFKIDVKYLYIVNYAYIVFKIILILLLCKIAIKIGSSVIEKFFKKQKASKYGFNDRKADTLSELLKNILRYAMYFIAVMWIFDAIGFDITTVIAVTSVAGVAIGFGAQNLVKDIISGFFILFEDQFSVGDYILIEGLSGVVEALGLRVTKLRDFSGDLHIIPNGSITKVTNKSRGNMRALVEFQVAYEEDIDHVVEVINKASEAMKKEFTQIIEGPSILGVSELGESGVKIRVMAKTLPMEQWGIENEMRKTIKKALDREGIEIPYPKRVLINDKGEKL